MKIEHNLDDVMNEADPDLWNAYCSCGWVSKGYPEVTWQDAIEEHETHVNNATG